MLEVTIGRPIRTDKMSTDRKSRTACLPKRLRASQSLKITAHLVFVFNTSVTGFTHLTLCRLQGYNPTVAGFPCPCCTVPKAKGRSVHPLASIGC